MKWDSKVMLTSVISLIFTAFFLVSCHQIPKHNYSNIKIELIDLNGSTGKTIDAVETGESLSISFRGLSPGAPVQIYLNDDTGQEWSYARLFANRAGIIGPTLF